MPETILVTGASGFIGRVVCQVLHGQGRKIIGTTRLPPSAAHLTVPEVDEWRACEFVGLNDECAARVVFGVDKVVHLGARAHVSEEMTANVLGLYRSINRDATATLARAAGRAGSQSFIYLSTVKVYGDSAASAANPLNAFSVPRPVDAYGISKWEAEQAVHTAAAEFGMEYSILRSPLVFGAGVKANFLHLMHWVYSGLPGPFGSVRNERSLVYVENVAAAIAQCLNNRKAAGETFLLSDATVSTAELFRRLSTALGKKTRVVAFPPKLLLWLGRTLGKEPEVQRLLQSLVVDASYIAKCLAWAPPVPFPKAIELTAQWYLNK